MILNEICVGVIHNKQMIKIFSSLLCPGEKNSVDTIIEAFRCFMQVFGNGRAKDLARRYNSNIMKGPSVGL